MNPAMFSLGSNFPAIKTLAGRQRSLAFSAAAELVAFVLTNAPQTASPCRCCRFAPPAFPKMLERALPKIDTRSNICRIHLENRLFCGWLGLFEQGVAQAERAWIAG